MSGIVDFVVKNIISKLLSKDFNFVRIDFYGHDNESFFSEFTIHPDAGYIQILPNCLNIRSGKLLI